MLVYDQRNQLNGAPGFHALITGVSNYAALPDQNASVVSTGPPTLGMKRLSSTALTAYRVYEWLLAMDAKGLLPVKLATIRLLLSPVQVEIDAEPKIAEAGAPCNTPNYQQAAGEWRDDAAANADNITFFYFAGHGIQRTKEDSVLLLEGFGRKFGGLLDQTVNLHNIFYGMAPSATYPNIARTQFYFVDACRNHPSRLNGFETVNTATVFNVETSGRDDRAAPIFYAAIADSRAYALSGRHTIFSEALLQCMQGAAGIPVGMDANGNALWGVTVASLNSALKNYFAALPPEARADQDTSLEGIIPPDTVLQHLSAPPQISLMLEIDPLDVHPYTKVEIMDQNLNPIPNIPSPLDPYPFSCLVNAGTYIVRANFAPPHSDLYKNTPLARPIWPASGWPLRFNWKILCVQNPQAAANGPGGQAVVSAGTPGPTAEPTAAQTAGKE